RNGVIQLEVAIAVPGERPDPIAWHDAKSGQRARELAGTGVGVAIGVAMDRSLDGARYDLGIAVIAVRVSDQRRDKKRHLHHQTLHGILLDPDGGAARLLSRHSSACLK